MRNHHNCHHRDSLSSRSEPTRNTLYITSDTSDFREWLEKLRIYIRIVEANMGHAYQLIDSQKNDYFCLH
ncbi:MAG: hypothetical protein GY696_12510 [Gammaproteobacteria bacterium]|nr:hypothetical protein [Gammaproteobacteria bacterium]